jgi:hypothetical protein
MPTLEAGMLASRQQRRTGMLAVVLDAWEEKNWN